MSRALWLLVLAVFLLSCSGPEDDRLPPTPIPGPPPTRLPLPDDATTSARIHTRGFLRVGVRYDLRPFGYVTDAGSLAGFDVDLGREFAGRWLHDDEEVEFRQVRSDTAVGHLLAGEVDLVIAALAHTQEGEAGADFSFPYFDDGVALLVHGEDVASFNGLADLEGRLVGVAGRGAAELLQAETPFTVTLRAFDRFGDAVGALDNGELDTVADYKKRLFWGTHLAPGSVVVGQYTSVPLALAFREDDPFFADLVNLTLQEMIADGSFSRLYARWFASDPLPLLEMWPGEGVPNLVDSPIVAERPDTIDGIRTRGRVFVSFDADQYPFSYIDEEGVPAGYEVDLVRLMAEQWLRDATLVDFFPVGASQGPDSLLPGQADLFVGGVAHTRAAEMRMDFSTATYLGGSGLLVQSGTEITELADLDGREVAVVQGDKMGDALLSAAESAGIAVAVLAQPSLPTAVTLLQGGRVAAIAAERTDLLVLSNQSPELDLLSQRLNVVPIGLGLPPGDSSFRDLVNLTLQRMQSEGRLDAIYAAWFGEPRPPMENWPGVPYRALRLEVDASANTND